VAHHEYLGHYPGPTTNIAGLTNQGVMASCKRLAYSGEAKYIKLFWQKHRAYYQKYNIIKVNRTNHKDDNISSMFPLTLCGLHGDSGNNLSAI